ncbi:hypothetical protein WG66_005364 [Moniliophthora roreri]|nr:hypothetical protein WG66_005364 [Moniliophthora roreri]
MITKHFPRVVHTLNLVQLERDPLTFASLIPFLSPTTPSDGYIVNSQRLILLLPLSTKITMRPKLCKKECIFVKGQKRAHISVYRPPTHPTTVHQARVFPW